MKIFSEYFRRALVNNYYFHVHLNYFTCFCTRSLNRDFKCWFLTKAGSPHIEIWLNTVFLTPVYLLGFRLESCLLTITEDGRLLNQNLLVHWSGNSVKTYLLRQLQQHYRLRKLTQQYLPWTIYSSGCAHRLASIGAKNEIAIELVVLPCS